MATLEKLIRTIDQLKIPESAQSDFHVKKKELRTHLLNLSEFVSSLNVQNHKDFVSYIGPSIDSLIQLSDSKDSDIRLACDEGLYKVIKALIPLHSNRVLVELCKQIKKGESPRILKLSMNRFAELAHLARPQKRRAYLANLLNAISVIANRKEEILHESLSNFVSKVFTVMGEFAYENETKTLLKRFLTNLSSSSSIIRRSAASAISIIISTNRKSDVLLALVVEYLTDQILLSEDVPVTDAAIITGTLLTLKLLLPLFKSGLTEVIENTTSSNSSQHLKAPAILNSLASERIIRVFELGVHYTFSSDHNVVNAALELLQQTLKMRSLILAVPAFKNPNGLHGTRISSRGIYKPNSQWNLTPLPVAEESLLMEAEVHLGEFDKTSVESIEIEADLADEELDSTCLTEHDFSKSKVFTESDTVIEEQDLEEVCVERENADSDGKAVDIGSLYDKNGSSPLLYCARHLSYNFLLTEKKGQLKSDRSVRVSVKSLALNCLAHAGSLEPLIWNSYLSESDDRKIAIIDVLQYSSHEDPQLRGQTSLLTCMVLNSVISGYNLTSVEVKSLVEIIDQTLKDKETAACRLALHGLELLLPTAFESSFCDETVPLLRSLLTLAENPYWLVRVDLLEVFRSFSWTALEFGICQQNAFDLPKFQEAFLHKVIFTMIGDEDHRVRSAVSNCLSYLVKSWTTTRNLPNVCRAKWLASDVCSSTYREPTLKAFIGVPLPIHGLAEAYRDIPIDETVIENLAYFVDEIFQLLVSSNSKFIKMGCLQALVSLSGSYPPTTYMEIYGCNSKESCSLLKTCLALMTNTTLMLDLTTHQSLLSLATRLFAGCVKAGLSEPQSAQDGKEWRFLNGHSGTSATCLLNHTCRILNAFCCVLEDVNPFSAAIKAPLVTLQGPSALSPIRRKLRSVEGPILDKDEKPEELGRKWSKPTQLLSPNNLGFFVVQPVYSKLYELLKGTHATCKLNFDTVTSERLSSFIQSTLEALAVLLEVSVFQDIGKHSEEILNYLRVIITTEPVSCLHSVQQLLKALFGANLAAVWHDEAARLKRSSISSVSPELKKQDKSFDSSCGLDEFCFHDSASKMSFSRTNERPNLITKFRTTINKMGPDKCALSSYIRLFEPMVIKALKLYTVTSCPQVQKQVLDLLCELIHLCVNYCLLDADQVFLNFVIQQFEFLEEGFIPQVEILLPSMFRFLSLLSYDRFHSKTIISVPRIMQLAGGLMATGKDAQLHVLPTLQPMVEDLFLSRERMNDNLKELETQKEVLINILLRLVQYPKVYPLITAVLIQVQFENASKWKSLSKQICDALIPQLNKHSLYLDSDEAVQMLQKLISHLDPPIVHESLIGLLQTFANKRLEDFNFSDYHRVLASRLTVFKTLIAVFDEPFLLDCLNEFSLSYLINQRSDPLNVTPTENSPPEQILSSLLLDTLQLALNYWKNKITSDNSWPTSISWKTDGLSFPVHLVLDLIGLCRQLLNSSDFPVLQATIKTELQRDDCKYSLFQVAKSTIPNNPLVFLRVCALFSSEIHLLTTEDMKIPFGGLNASIATAGFFLLRCEQVAKHKEKIPHFIGSNADSIIVNHKEKPVKTLLNSLSDDNMEVFYSLFKWVLSQHDEALAISAITLLNLMESVTLKRPETFLIDLLSSLQTIESEAVHYKLCQLILKTNFASTQSKFQCFEKVEKITHQSKNKRAYSAILSIPRGCSDNKPNTLNAIDKKFVLDFALCRGSDPAIWKEIIPCLDSDDLPGLLNNQSCLLFALGNRRILKYDLFVRAKTVFFDRMSAVTFEDSQVLLIAHAVSELCKSISRSEVKEVFTAPELSKLAKMPLIFMGAMGPLSRSLVLLRASAEVVSVFDRELPDEWSNRENLSAVYKAIDSLELLCSWLKKEAPLTHPTITGFEGTNDVNLAFVRAAQQLSRMISFVEKELKQTPKLLHQQLVSIVKAFCRMPLFYSYSCIPPSVWGKDWNPKFNLDMELIKFDLPVIPSHFLHDEIVLEEFVYRVDQIGWISRQKFEEIWMTFLGILNLHNDDQVRPEEQASVIQATCEAVRALTMVLQKNLPFTSSRAASINELAPVPDFMFTERGKKLNELCSLLEGDCKFKSPCKSTYLFNRLSFRHIQFNLNQGSPSKKKPASPEEVTDIDIQSCVHFLVDLYSQWLQNSNTPYQLLVDLFRSLVQISDFFVDVQQFEQMLDSAIILHKQLLPDDPASLESALVRCILKSAAFVPMKTEYWEVVKKLCETSLSSQHISTRASGLDGLLYLLQRFSRNNLDLNRIGTLVNLAMDYAGKYLGSGNSGPIWHQSWLWSIAFYCGEHFASLPYHNCVVVDFVVQCALNGIVDNQQHSIEIQREILQGLERLCILGVLAPKWRIRVKLEVLNIIRNVDRGSILQSGLRTLLALVYSDFGSQLYKPGADPETMLVAMEWVGTLFQRMKRGTDSEAELLGRIMPVIACDIFPPADILNRILSEFMTARPMVACSLTPTIFKVFGTARAQGQQSLVVEWILLSLANFTRAPNDKSDISVWNILCFFTAASDNPWLQSVFPLMSRPVNQNDSLEICVFVASALNFQSQLNDQQRTTLASIFSSAKEKSSFFAAVDTALNHL